MPTKIRYNARPGAVGSYLYCMARRVVPGAAVACYIGFIALFSMLARGGSRWRR